MEHKRDFEYSGNKAAQRAADPGASVTAWETLHGGTDLSLPGDEPGQAPSEVDKLDDAVAAHFASIEEVRHVLVERGNKFLPVWIAIDNAGSHELRRRVYAKEMALMQAFPDVQFDFNLLPAMGRTPAELASEAEVLFTRS